MLSTSKQTKKPAIKMSHSSSKSKFCENNETDNVLFCDTTNLISNYMIKWNISTIMVINTTKSQNKLKGQAIALIMNTAKK